MIGERLVDLRQDKGLKQKEFADIIGVSVHTLSNYENEKTTPDDLIKVKIAEFFNVTLDYLLGIIREPRPIHTPHMISLREDIPESAVEEIKQYIEFIEGKYGLK